MQGAPARLGKGVCRLAIPETPQAKTCSQQVIAIARHQQARSWEQHAAVNLAQLWQQQGQVHSSSLPPARPGLYLVYRRI
jgi:hypothetical protein